MGLALPGRVLTPRMPPRLDDMAQQHARKGAGRGVPKPRGKSCDGRAQAVPCRPRLGYRPCPPPRRAASDLAALIYRAVSGQGTLRPRAAEGRRLKEGPPAVMGLLTRAAWHIFLLLRAAPPRSDAPPDLSASRDGDDDDALLRQSTGRGKLCPPPLECSAARCKGREVGDSQGADCAWGCVGDDG